jgi:hypothetical protein
MAKKKAPTVKNVCSHCQKEFLVPIRWCQNCEDHMGPDSFAMGKDICDRCHAGDNDDYIKHKKGSAKRIEKELERIQKEHGPIGSSPGPLVLAYEKWVASEQYNRRFEAGPLEIPVVVSDAVPENRAVLISETGDAYERKVHVVGVGTDQPAVTLDLEESGIWPPEEVLERVFGALGIR